MRWLVLLLLILLASLQYRLWVGQGSWAEITALQDQIEQQQQINQRLQARNAVLEKEVKDLKSGMESVEERARNELGLVKEGETFYLVIDKNKDDDKR
jgi:cell division protein FtsB